MADRQRRRALHTGSKRWRELREQVLREQPFCPLCLALGRAVAATDVDHRDGNDANNARANLWGLCHSHHSEKTAVEMVGKVFRPKGCDADGWPLAPQ
jgi:5-methylcytosine-specific restriction protein A